MKFCRFLIFLSSCILISIFSYGQNSSGITFIRFNSYVGYVIDSAENQRCKCVTFAGDKFIYGSLIQLPDSDVEFRMKASDREDFYNIPMTKPDVERIASRTPLINQELTVENDEKKYLKSMAGNSEIYKLMDYPNLKYKSIQISPKIAEDSSFNYPFLNIGLGLTNRAGKESYFSWVGDFGVVRNRNIIGARIWYNRFVDLFPVISTGPGTNVTPNEHITEIGILYGRMFPMDRMSFTVNAGLSYSSGVLKGKKISSSTGWFSQNEEYESRNFNEVGIPLKLEMLLGSRRKSKVSFALLADFNTAYVYYGLIFSVRISNEYRPVTSAKKSH